MTKDLLKGAEAPVSQREEGAEVIAAALEAAPDDPDVLLAAYRFYYYTHDYVAARTQAHVLLGHVARRLNVSPDWRDVRPEDADFTEHEFAPGLYLQVLVAIGYCAARTGQRDEAQAVLEKAAELDPTDRFGGAWILDKIDPQDDAEAD
jgi:tetratricopeptide (TPR) repeat protein